MRTARRNAPVLAAILGCWLAVTLVCWIVTRAAFAASVRRLLAVHFVARLADPGRRRDLDLAAQLEDDRGRSGCIALVALVQWISPAGRAGAERIPLWFADSILGVWSLLWAALAGVALARTARRSWERSYRTARSRSPHGRCCSRSTSTRAAARADGARRFGDWCRSRRCWRSPRSSRRSWCGRDPTTRQSPRPAGHRLPREHRDLRDRHVEARAPGTHPRAARPRDKHGGERESDRRSRRRITAG